MSSTTATTLTDATLEKLEKLTSSFAVLALAMKQSSDEFKDAALEFSKTMEAVRAAPAFVPPPPIDTATPAAEKAAAAVAAVAPPIDTATPAAQKAAKAVAEAEREHHFQEMEKRRKAYSDKHKIESSDNFMNNRVHYDLLSQRMEEYRDGCVRTINGKYVLVYKYHAFEMPANRSYREPGPLTSIGAIDPDTKAIHSAVIVAPELPTTVSAWPWR